MDEARAIWGPPGLGGPAGRGGVAGTAGRTRVGGSAGFGGAVGRPWGRLGPGSAVGPMAPGARRVLRSLERLVVRDPRWRLLHGPTSVPGSTADDHLLVGPGGVLAFRVHDLPGSSVWVDAGTIKVDGTCTPHVRSARRTASAVQTTLADGAGLDVHVEPVVVLARCRHFTLRQPPEGVVVVRGDDLAALVRERSPLLQPAQARAVQRVAAALLTH